MFRLEQESAGTGVQCQQHTDPVVCSCLTPPGEGAVVPISLCTRKCSSSLLLLLNNLVKNYSTAGAACVTCLHRFSSYFGPEDDSVVIVLLTTKIVM